MIVLKEKGGNMYKQIPWTLNETKVKKKKNKPYLKAETKVSRKKAKNKDKSFTLFGWQIIIKD